MRGKEDPFATVGVANDRSQKDGTNEYVKVLNDINFEVKKGEVLGIIGKNGAGKSTLLKVISQITSPTTGSVKAKGRIASLLEVGTGMHPEMTGKENVYLNGTILGMTRKEIDAKFDEIMDFAGCAKYADTPVKRYSSGMKVRLGFAVAAFLEPEILIVDEVLAVGDAEFQKKAIGKMQDISKGDGRTVLFVSHNMASVKALCKKALVLDSGHIAFKGAVSDAVDFYLNQSAQSVEMGEIDDQRGTYKTGRASIKSVLLLNEKKEKTTQFYFGEKISVQLELELSQAFLDPLFDVRVKSLDGLELVHICNFYENAESREYVAGHYKVGVTFENTLQPGHYTLTFGVHSSNGETHFYLEDLIGIDIQAASRSQKGFVFNWKAGYVRSKSEWNILS